MKIFNLFVMSMASVWTLTPISNNILADNSNDQKNGIQISLPDTLYGQSVPNKQNGSKNESKSDHEKRFSELPKSKSPNLESISSTVGAEPRYLAIGGSLTAGVRSGGLYRYAQLTSYPNLIARQMGLKNFGQPLFDPSEGNGSGYLKLRGTYPFPQFEKVDNNTAILRTNPLTFSSYRGRVDNLGLPYMGVYGFGDRQDWRNNDQLAPSIPYDMQYRHHFRRYLANTEQQWWTSVLEQAVSQKSDLCTIELGIDDFIVFATTGGYKTAGLPMGTCNEAGNPFLRLLQYLKTNKTNTVLSTVPDIRDFPYFNFVTPTKARAQNGGGKLYAMVSDDLFEISKGNPQFLTEIADTDILLPTENVQALFSASDTKRGISPQHPLESRDVLTQDELKALALADSFNEIVRYQAQKLDFPVLDLHSLYKRIMAGGYITDDGIQIDPTFPNGNFFSQDGLHPTALGQAVIANEWIKLINQHYKTAIPTVDTAKINGLGRE